MMTDWTPTRAEGETILAAFTPRMGRRYANGRNTDDGTGAHKAVSVLSPYIRRRLVLESDAVAVALAAHRPEDAEKFVQEVIWRGYFKGWLERRPQVWDSYRSGLEADLLALDRDRRLRRDVDRATGGQTGLTCFDAWAEELVETGYLHNHARMWFASIWIFTLGLPWRLGADFFFRHLLDGDAASTGSATARRAAWAYDSPKAGFGPLTGYAAFYAALMDEVWVGGLRVLPQPGNFYGDWVTPNLDGRIKGAPGTQHW